MSESTKSSSTWKTNSMANAFKIKSMNLVVVVSSAMPEKNIMTQTNILNT